jgi:hypothetical protein
VHKAHKAHKVLKVTKEHKAHKVHKVIKVLRVVRVLKVLKVCVLISPNLMNRSFIHSFISSLTFERSLNEPNKNNCL